MTLKEDLLRFLGDPKDRRVAIVGIGSDIRRDDAVGLIVVDHLEDKNPRGDVLLLKTETRPENFTGEIRRFRATHVLMVDAAHFNGAAGEARIIHTQMIAGGNIVSTHRLPLTVFSNYLEKTLCTKVALIGIQSQDIGFGTGVTPELERAAEEVAQTIYECLV